MGNYSDPYFEGDANVLRTYEFHYAQVTKFDNDVMWATACIPPCCFPYNATMACCFLAANNRDASNAMHLALTRDGIRFVFDKHPTACRLAMCDIGRTSKTVPFDKLTDCDVQEPAGTAVCCCVDNVLTAVTVDTASGREMVLRGLKDPFAFKSDVWGMKRGDGLSGVPDSVVATSMTRMEAKPKDVGGSWFAGGSAAGGPGMRAEEVSALLQKADKVVSLLTVIAENTKPK
ncbi:hypothetical protein T492DRAFT_1066181 [Pavlovales sp. CCMP2436]|nr:hypothetical protein T492DRAFT_1066181 [Pavlovales sp. CCMP2436]